jgi:hypothetical protein
MSHAAGSQHGHHEVVGCTITRQHRPLEEERR